MVVELLNTVPAIQAGWEWIWPFLLFWILTGTVFAACLLPPCFRSGQPSALMPTVRIMLIIDGFQLRRPEATLPVLLSGRVNASTFALLVSHEPVHPIVPVWEEQLAWMPGDAWPRPYRIRFRVLGGSPLARIELKGEAAELEFNPVEGPIHSSTQLFHMNGPDVGSSAGVIQYHLRAEPLAAAHA